MKTSFLNAFCCKFVVMGRLQNIKRDNLIVYNATISKNTNELNSIDPKKKILLLFFFMYFMDRYKNLMSELSNE